MRTADFDYELPKELIAQAPLPERDASRLLVVDRAAGTTAHHTFADFPGFPAPADVVVINDSRVIPARLSARRRGGGAAEVLLVTREAEGAWRALVRPGARIRPLSRLDLGDGDEIEVIATLEGGQRRVRLHGVGGDEAIIQRRGQVPLPPYIARPPEPADRERYQTVYADAPGSVAAPTAGLHFTAAILAKLADHGVTVARLTLHVGPGTFRPVTAHDPAQHRLDPEAYTLSPEAARAIASSRGRGGKVWAVGTTVTRTLETCAAEDGTVRPGAGWTSLFIRPGHTFRVVDRLLTNFHLPRSTLLMLVSAFAGREAVMRAYEEAIRQRYRFYSYGDAMLIV
ncbi:MAG: tRNA preQ1(34) S-adenosylmethionine ribosyltransferase-isomerase QueA [Gemmatimonadales bacterium]|jgi:S-adenosylmethionine:tRNA ribosyltransferase-isomerase